MQLQGTIKYIGKVTERKSKDGTKTYQSQKILLSVVDGTYTNVFPIDIAPRLQDAMDNYREGQQVTAHINMRGNEYVNKEGKPDAFLSFSAWKLEAQGSTPVQQNADYVPVDESHDPLPF